MFFSYAARVVAIFALIGGLFNVSGGIAIANGWIAPADAALHRYFGNVTVGQVIDQGTYYVLVAVALGALAEVGLHLGKLRKNSADSKQKSIQSPSGRSD